MPISDPFDDVDVIRKISTKKKVDTEKDKDRKQAIGLLENAIDFFERAMAAINNDPKESIINFSTAVELILKFPLVLEHWSLIVVCDKKKLNRQEFLEGGFQSITFEETYALLNGVFKATMDKETISILTAVRQHRNRMVHYFNHNLNDPKHKKAIMEEQATAWFRLNSFLKTNSKKLNIEEYQQQLDDLEKKLVAYSQYAEQKYISLKPKIDGLKKSDVKFEMCYACNQEAKQVSKGDFFLNRTCLVCESTNIALEVKCPKCHDDQILYNPNHFECDKCNHEIIFDSDIYKLLDESRQNNVPGDNTPNRTPANCIECESDRSVCLHKGKYLCIYCWTVSPKLHTCGYCSEYMNIDVEESHFYGCPFCEGYMSHVMSKD